MSKKKIRESFLIKPGNRSLETKEKFSEWIEAQSNAQNSLLSLILHVIDRFGYVDVTDHEVAKRMYADILNTYVPSTNVTASTIPIVQNVTEKSTDMLVEKEKPKEKRNIDISKY